MTFYRGMMVRVHFSDVELNDEYGYVIGFTSAKARVMLLDGTVFSVVKADVTRISDRSVGNRMAALLTELAGADLLPDEDDSDLAVNVRVALADWDVLKEEGTR